MMGLWELLASESREYLIDCKGGHAVPLAEAMEGKSLVGIMFGPLPSHGEDANEDEDEEEEGPLEVSLREVSEALAGIEPETRLVFVALGSVKESKISIPHGHDDGDDDDGGSEKRINDGDSDGDDDGLQCFNDYVRKSMPPGCLAVPWEDSVGRSKLVANVFGSDLTAASSSFGLALVGVDGRVHTTDGFKVLEELGAEGFPFTEEKVRAVCEWRAENQTFKSLLLDNGGRDYLVRNNGTQIKVEDLEGKIVGLYFSAHWCGVCEEFTPLMASVYKQLKENQEDFEVVFISADRDQESFDTHFQEMPWLAIPFLDGKTKRTLSSWFDVEGIPTLIILDKQGRTLQVEGVKLISEHGAKAYPFSTERLINLQKEEQSTHTS